MTDACRTKLNNLASAAQFTNVGLGLDRYLSQHANAGQKKANVRPEVTLLQAACNSVPPEVYSQAYRRWKDLCIANRMLQVEGTLSSSLAIGVGKSSPLEVGIHLHHTYGMPLIPGSAVKGVCRFAAKQQVDIASCIGALTFWDAWYDPGSTGGRPFHRDVITVHHPNYYTKQGDTRTWPTDFDSPVPINFLVVKPGARFLFAVSCASDKWETFAGDMLKHSLENVGFGAKSNAGYGRFTGVKIIPPPPIPMNRMWHCVQVTRKASPMEFSFTYEGEQYRITSAKADEINRSFSSEFREHLKKNKSNIFAADVLVTITGESADITAIKPLLS